jgi:hypothetical protein
MNARQVYTRAYNIIYNIIILYYIITKEQSVTLFKYNS